MAYVRELCALAALAAFVCGFSAVGLVVVEKHDTGRSTIMAEAR